MEKTLESCKIISVTCKADLARKILFGRKVSKGFAIHDCEIRFTAPTECIVDVTTEIREAKNCIWNTEIAKDNVVITQICDKNKEVLVYPEKVWTELKKLYIDPIINNEPPFNTGVILSGPPGTGKTRMAQLIADMAGLPSFSVDVANTLNIYVGESEKSLSNTIKTAIDAKPSVIVIDEAEWLLGARKLSGNDTMIDGSARVTNNLKTILFTYMQKVYNEKIPVLFIAATNIKPTGIDPAFKRHGRFGEPIFFPLPDYNAIKTVIDSIISDQKLSTEVANYVVNSGLSMIDAVGSAMKAKMGMPYKLSGKEGGRGYVRIHMEPNPIFENAFRENNYFIHRETFQNRSTTYIHGYMEVVAPLIAQLAFQLKKPAIRLTDTRQFEEAAYTADVYSAIMLVPTSKNPEVIYYIRDNTDVPLFLVGKQPPNVDMPYSSVNITYLPSRLKSGDKTDTNIAVTIMKTILDYNQIKYDENLLVKVASSFGGSYDKLFDLMEEVVARGYINNMLVQEKLI